MAVLISESSETSAVLKIANLVYGTWPAVISAQSYVDDLDLSNKYSDLNLKSKMTKIYRDNLDEAELEAGMDFPASDSKLILRRIDSELYKSRLNPAAEKFARNLEKSASPGLYELESPVDTSLLILKFLVVGKAGLELSMIYDNLNIDISQAYYTTQDRIAMYLERNYPSPQAEKLLSNLAKSSVVNKGAKSLVLMISKEIYKRVGLHTFTLAYKKMP